MTTISISEFTSIYSHFPWNAVQTECMMYHPPFADGENKGFVRHAHFPFYIICAYFIIQISFRKRVKLSELSSTAREYTIVLFGDLIMYDVKIVHGDGRNSKRAEEKMEVCFRLLSILPIWFRAIEIKIKKKTKRNETRKEKETN